MSSKQMKTYLGRSLIKNLKNKRHLNKAHWIHSDEFYEGSTDHLPHNLQSILEENALEQLLIRAEKANQNFDDERNIHYISPEEKNMEMAEGNRVYLRLPRRPHPPPGIDVNAWAQFEEKSFTDWRRSIAAHIESVLPTEGKNKMGTEKSVVVTPFEKNLEVWRQLWRVIERSDIVVQIVDARDAYFYRNFDLESYVREGCQPKSTPEAEPRPNAKTSYELDDDNVASSEEDDAQGSEFSGDDSDNDAKTTQPVVEPRDGKVSRVVGTASSNETDDDHLANGTRPKPEETPDSNEAHSELSGKPAHVERGKINVLLLNKSDLLSKQQREHWRTHLSTTRSGLLLSKTDLGRPVQASDRTLVIFFSAKKSTTPPVVEGTSQSLASDKSRDDVPEHELDIFNPDELIHLFRHCLKPLFPQSTIKLGQADGRDKKFTNIHKHIFTVGFVGYPNVGKSSTINALLKAKKVAVSATPGKTKHLQTHLLPEKDIYLCDCPGLVMPNFVESKADLIVHGIIPIDTITDPLSPIQLICNRVGLADINLFYGLELQPPTLPLKAQDLLTAHSASRGFTTTLAQPDFHKSARIILKDYVNGRLVYCHAPTGCDVEIFQSCAKPLHLSKAQTNALEEVLAHNDTVGAQVGHHHIENKADQLAISTGQPIVVNKSNKKTVLDPQVEAESQLDSEFFKRGPHGVAKVNGGISILSINSKVAENVKTLNPGKKHFNKNRREKLRRLNPNPW